MKILVLGSNGQLGHCLVDQFSNSAYQTIFTTRSDLDITDFLVAKEKIGRIKPDLIINASAYTAVDKAEEDQEKAYLINHLAVANIADICRDLYCGLVHVSTDYVFDGTGTEPYIETDTTDPQGVYGDSKLLGEQAIEASGCQYLIIRTSWVFSEYGNNFLKTMLRLGAECNELNIVRDQVGCPTYAQDIARCIFGLADLFQKDHFESEIFHFCGDRTCSWYQFALAIFTAAAKKGLPTPACVKGITTEEYPTPAPRPAYSVLDCDKLTHKFGITSSDWQKAIPEVIDKLL
jgi:dTDP-4-dehydrorhamnose reductase